MMPMRTVISASRRTDIPAFYMRWLDNRIKKGYVDVRNPVVKERTYRVSLRPEDVHSIVLWSKNFRPFLNSELSRSNQYEWYFNFSLVDCPEWEKSVPPLTEQLRQVKEISERWSGNRINWRFDPIVFWDRGNQSNIDSFYTICDHMAECGVSRGTFSFVTWYNKVKKRVAEQGMDFYDPPLSKKLEILSRFSAYANPRGIVLESCCNDALLQADGVVKGSCVNGYLLTQLTGERCSLARDSSQRHDCGCTKSSDIGSYEMSCPHGCVYCYAKPVFFNSKLVSSNHSV